MQTQAPIKRSQVMGLAFLAFVVVFVLWQTSDGSNIPAFMLYPFRLFVTFVHETAHGLTAVLTGGQFQHFVIAPNGSGVAHIVGGNTFLILQMGYIGAALFGSFLLYTANRTRRVNVVAALVGTYFAASAILFTADGRLLLLVGVVASIVLWLLGEHYRQHSSVLWGLAWLTLCGTLIVGLAWGGVALTVGIIGGAMLLGLSILAPRPVIIFVLNALAFITGLNAISDIWYLTKIGSATSDASMTASLTGIPAGFWIGFWAVIALAVMGFGAYLAFIKRDEPITETVKV